MSQPAPKFKRRPSCSITFEFTLFGEDRDREYADAMGEAIFEHLQQGPLELDGYDYSIDSFDVEYREPRPE